MHEERSEAPPQPANDPQQGLPRYPRSRGPRPFQFSLRSLLILTTVVAVAAVLLPVLGIDFVSGLTLVLMTFAVPVCLVTAAIYSRGTWQTFFIGAACLACLSATYLRGMGSVSGLGLLMLSAYQLFTITLAGGLAIASRRFVERRGWHLPPQDWDSQGRD